jgi:hypothetical protein
MIAGDYLKEGQWYALPSGRWARATQRVTALQHQTAVGPLPSWSLHVYGSSDGRWAVEYQVSIDDNGVLGVTGLLTWESWTVEQLREATPDEAEMLTHRATGTR